MSTPAKKLNIVAASTSSRKSRRRGEFITFHPSTGKICFSLSLVDKLSIKNSEFVIFYSERDVTRWYMRIGTEDMPLDKRLKLTKPTAMQKRDYSCTSKMVCLELLKSAKVSTTNSRSFKLKDQEPITHEGNTYYEIDTKNPL
jgi:hypothetical protein